MMRTLRLYGPMGARFGRSHKYDLDSGTPREAFAALMSQVQGVREYLTNAKANGIVFAIFVGKRNISADHLTLPANEDIRIVPVPAAAKRAGVLQTIVGIVLVVVDVLWLHTGYVSQLGYGLIAGGVAQMLTPMPHGKSSRDSASNQANYSFNGPVNTQAQGNPVPLGYGRLKVGSAVVSAGIDTLDTSTTHYWGGFGFMGGGGGPDPRNPHIALPD